MNGCTECVRVNKRNKCRRSCSTFLFYRFYSQNPVSKPVVYYSSCSWFWILYDAWCAYSDYKLYNVRIKENAHSLWDMCAFELKTSTKCVNKNILIRSVQRCVNFGPQFRKIEHIISKGRRFGIRIPVYVWPNTKNTFNTRYLLFEKLWMFAFLSFCSYCCCFCFPFTMVAAIYTKHIQI